jgi:biopolymer transport protein ExbD
MNFQRGASRETLEINLIPLIDVLLVILIFLMVTTTYARYAELKINLPTAAGDASQQKPEQIQITVDAGGKYQVNDTVVGNPSIEGLRAALRTAAGKQADPVIVINADARATHQSVIRIMEAAREEGYGRITFATQAE